MTLRDHRKKLIVALSLLVVLVAGGVFWREIFAWFSGEPLTTTVSDEDAVTAQAGPFELGATLAPDPPRQEGNRLNLLIRDQDGEPVEDAEVNVTYMMPAMGAMAEMRGESDIEEKGDGRYVASFDLPMGGSWSLIVGVEEGDRSGEATFNMTVGSSGLTVVGGGGSSAMAEAKAPDLPSYAFDDETLARLQAAFAAYDQVRILLARDELEELKTQTPALRAAFEAAAKQLARGESPSEIAQCLSDVASLVDQLGQATSLEEARRLFGEISMYAVALGAADPRLGEGWIVFKCPMTKTFPKWIQRSPPILNPYMGQQMPECGVRSDWTMPLLDEEAHAHADGEISHYTCAMHPSVKQSDEGTCPICAMDLTAVSKQEVETGTIFVDEARRQSIGVRTAEAKQRPLDASIRALGEVQFDETELYEVSPRTGGWVEKLFVEESGQKVKKGEPLFAFYSPDLYAAQLDHLLAVRNIGQSNISNGSRVLEASRRRLQLLGMSTSQIRNLERRGKANETVTIPSPATGYVVEKNVVEGAKVEAGATIYRIADLDRVWIDADVYEQDLPHIKKGQNVEVTLPHMPNQTFEGKVDYIYPTLQGKTRTAKIRVVLENPELELKPNMYANVAFEVNLGERLAIPESAVIYTGPRRLVFIDLGEGRLRPQEVELGVYADGFFEVTKGLEPGDVVVSSGNFLIAAESRLRSATDVWEGSDAANN